MKFFILIVSCAHWNGSVCNAACCDELHCEFNESLTTLQAGTKRRYTVVEGIHVLVLECSHYEMGQDYGRLLKKPLHETLSMLKSHFIDDFGLSPEVVYKKAMQFQERYSPSFEPFLKGVTEGAHLSLEECIMLNGMETLNSLKREKDIAHCAFVTVPFEKTVASANLLGRNYDFPAPYEKCAKHVVVTILKEANKSTTAIIGMAGQIYCPTCINEAGLFLELNNGMPSGGYTVNYTRQSLFIRLLEILQNSPNINQLKRQLISTLPDYSLIVNAADNDEVFSLEYSSTSGHQVYMPPSGAPFVSTNYFQSSSWNGIPTPTDELTWTGVTRRENLLKCARNLPDKASAKDLMNAMDLDISEGGARWALTIYQIVFDTNDFSLYISRPGFNPGHWALINLKELFDFEHSL